MRAPRWVHRIRAWYGGYFWLPCTNCGRYGGGHEWRLSPNGHFNSVWGWSKDPVAPRPVQWGICQACTEAGVGCRSHAEAGWHHEDCEFAPAPRS